MLIVLFGSSIINFPCILSYVIVSFSNLTVGKATPSIFIMSLYSLSYSTIFSLSLNSEITLNVYGTPLDKTFSSTFTITSSLFVTSFVYTGASSSPVLVSYTSNLYPCIPLSGSTTFVNLNVNIESLLFISYSGPLISGLFFNVLNVFSCSKPLEIICPSYKTFVNLIVYSVFDCNPINSAVSPAIVPFPTSYVCSTVPLDDINDNCALFTFESVSTDILNFRELFVNTSFSNVIPTLFVLNILYTKFLVYVIPSTSYADSTTNV